MTSTTPTEAFEIGFQPALADILRSYNLALPALDTAQSNLIPQIFRDSMTVRESVFVKEQHAVPLQHHIDRDDARSCHWVLYYPSSLLNPHQPIGTIRLVPAPHWAHPTPGARFEAPGEEVPRPELFASPLPEYAPDRPTDFHDGSELYVKLGRLCVLKESRGKRYADLMIQAALKWVKEHPNFASGGTGMEWRGLVCVHAQEKAVGTWKRNGFAIDGKMESWFEGGVKHVGMFLRL
jgi:predicted GNAT family N-acyltransferase